MRKVKLLAALVLVLAVMVALKCCNGKEKETPEALTNDQEAVETIAKPDGEEVPLGVVAENESGGVSITVTGEDGAQGQAQTRKPKFRTDRIRLRRRASHSACRKRQLFRKSLRKALYRGL